MADYDRYSELDPAKLRREIEANFGIAIPASLDDSPEAMCQRVNASHAGTVSVYGEADPHLMCSQLAAGGGVSANVLQLNGQNLQLNGQDLTLGA